MAYNHWDDIFKKLQLGEEVAVAPRYTRETIRTTLAKRVSKYKKELAQVGMPVPHITLTINSLHSGGFAVKMTETPVTVGVPK